MKLALHNALLCCFLAILMPCARSAPFQLTSEESINLEYPCVHEESWKDSAERLSQSNEMEVVSEQHSAQMSERVKRGCNLLTCMVHDLTHRINNTNKRTESAPQDKISPQGYGRRRRRSTQLRPAPRGLRENRFRLLGLQSQQHSSPLTQT